MVVRKRLDFTGPEVVFITTTIRDWIPIFTHENAAKVTLRELNNTICLFPVSVMAFVLMPSHFHAIFHFEKIEQLSKFMQCFKSISSRRIKELITETGHYNLGNSGKFQLWKPRFDDFYIRNLKQFEIKLNYIHDNPVRAGLVEKAIDYKFSSARAWQTGEEGLISIEKNIGW
jgi:putative transposase